MKILLFVVIVGLVLSGCATDINRVVARETMVGGAIAQKQGDWNAARLNFAKAVVNARLAGAPDQTRAVLHYEYGRSLGVTCFFDLAEQELSTALELDRKSGQPEYLALNELARLNFDQGRYDKALAYFTLAQGSMQKFDAEKRAPAAYSDVLDEMSRSAAALQRTEEAGRLAAEAKRVRSASGPMGSITERTPYGKHCVK